MRYDHDGSLVIVEICLEPFKHVQIQMVRRFVEHEHIRLAQEQTAESQPGPLPSGELADFFILSLFIEAHMSEHRSELAFICIPALAFVLFDQKGVFFEVFFESHAFMIGDRQLEFFEFLLHLEKVCETLLRLRPYCSAPAEMILLAEISYVKVVPYVKISGCRLYVSGDDAEKSTLACAVCSDYAHTVTLFHTKTDIFKNDVCPVCFAYVFTRDYQHNLKLQSGNRVKLEVRLCTGSVRIISSRSYHGSVVGTQHRARLEHIYALSSGFFFHQCSEP